MELRQLTRAERRAYDFTVAGHHDREVEILLLTKDGRVIHSFPNQHMGGSITGDTSRLPVEVCDVDVIDPDYSVNWARGEHRKYDLQVIDSRFVPDLDDWVEETVFTGPIKEFDHEGGILHLTAEGAERKAMGSVRRVYSAPRKTRATRVIRDLLSEAGATSSDMSIPQSRAVLPERVTVGVNRGKDRNPKKSGYQGPRRQVFRATLENTYYEESVEIAEALDRDLFPDGRGRFLLRAPRTRPSLRLSRDTMLSPAKPTGGEEGVPFNTWLVQGADPKGPKGRIEVEVGLPRRHPESAEAQAWNEKPYKIIERIENSKLRSVAAARKVGLRRREKALREPTHYEVQSLPLVPWVRPGMLVTFPSPAGRASARVNQWTIPLGPGPDPLVFGAKKRQRGVR